MTGLAGLAGCSGFDTNPENRASVLENGVFGDIRARRAGKVANEPQGLIPVDSRTGRSQIFGPDGTAYADPGAGAGDPTGSVDGVEQSTDGPEAYRLNFENAEIRDVVQAVLGEALKLNYTLTPDVAGTVTISSARPVSRNELLSTLETVLAAQGFSMTKAGAIYKIGPIVAGPGAVDRGTRTEPGYGVSIVPLRYVSPRTMTRLLGGFVVDAEGLRVDSTKNAVIVSGPGARREEAVRTILSFDEDWMQGQTVGIFEVRRGTPESVVADLERVFDSGGSGGSAGVIQFKPITRLKSVLAVSKNAQLVARAEAWIRRLDQDAGEAGQNLFVYRAQYRDSKDLVRILSSLFGGSTGGLDNSTNTGTGNANADTGFSLDQGNSNEDAVSGADAVFQQSADGSDEPPIDNVTGAGEDGAGTAGDGSDTAPGVIDLTRQPGSGEKSDQIRFSADTANNSVITFTDPTTYRRVLVALHQLDSAPLQVAINVTIAEVRLTNELKYGIQYFVKSGTVSGAENKGSLSFSSLGGKLAAGAGFNFLLGSNSNPELIVNALDEITDVEVLSSPSLAVLENQTATLQVGDEVPITVRSSQSTDSSNDRLVNEIEYRNTGIILKVTPRIGENGAVTMDIQQEISSVANANSNTLTPTLSKRRVTSHVSVVDGQTVVLAGLITASKDRDKSGLPLLSRIPIAGDAFGTNGKSTNRTELVVMIRPQIVRNGEDAQAVAEDLRSRMWAIGSRERKSP